MQGAHKSTALPSRCVEFSGAVLCTPFRVCASSTTAQGTATQTSASSRWIPQSAQNIFQRLDSVGRAASAHTPESVKQLASAATEGKLLRVAGIQSNNIWLRFGGVVVAVACAGGTYAAYKASQGVYSAVTGIRESAWTLNAIAGGATLGLLSYVAYRHQFVISPAAVHHEALRLLRADPAVREVLRLPITGDRPLLSIVDGGRLKFKWLVVPRWQPQRIQMTFPVAGADASAVALLEAKKLSGRHLFKLLAVDVPSKAPLGAETRIFVRGSAEDLEGAAEEAGGWWGSRGRRAMAAAGAERGRVFEELREPLRRVMQAEQAVDREDEEDERKMQAEERQRQLEAAAARAAAAPKPLDEGGGMYVYERLYWQAHYGFQRVYKHLFRRSEAQ